MNKNGLQIDLDQIQDKYRFMVAGGTNQDQERLSLAILERCSLLLALLAAKFHGGISENFPDVFYRTLAPL